MDPLTSTAASGMRARMESLDMLANNVANAATGGYKSDREFYDLYVSPEAADGNSPTAMPLIERPYTDYSQGDLHPTGNPLDLAIAGKGFFVVDGPTGPLYTRNGAFTVSPTGILSTAGGFPVRTVSGKPVTLQPNSVVEISANGSVTADGQVVGALAVADFPSTDALVKQGANYFIADPKVKPTLASGAIHQGKIETSNAGAAESAVRLITVMRQFEMLQKAASLGAEMNRKAIEEVARVG
jgi:flagellar basal-body rod protein FlgF